MSDLVEERPLPTSPVSQSAEAFLRDKLDKELGLLKHAAEVQSDIYESLKRTDLIFASQYGDRALLELFQNAHDAHPEGGSGEVWIRLDLNATENAGTLYVANRGLGFTEKNITALRNLARSSKPVGEGIGNKGLGFRSVETLSHTPRIYSQAQAIPKERFDGFCFRFLSPEEVANALRERMLVDGLVQDAANSVSPYLMCTPLADQSDTVRAFARDGFATAIVIPLSGAEAVAKAREQMLKLLVPEAPLLLFLDRLERVRLSIVGGEHSVDHVLRRSVSRESDLLEPGISCQRVHVDGAGEFLVGRVLVANADIISAVERSIGSAPALATWLEFEGDVSVSVALPLEGALSEGRMYSYLPMGVSARAPMPAHVNALFFTHVDRRDIDLDLPLNALLIGRAAHLCAALATDAASGHPPASLAGTPAFRLVLWKSRTNVLTSAFERRGTPLSTAAIFPRFAPRGGRLFGALQDLVRWPDGLSVFAPARSTSICEAPIIAASLAKSDIEAIEELASRVALRSLNPEEDRLCGWVESMARHLAANGATSLSRWTTFYDEIVTLFEKTGSDLKVLCGRSVILQRGRSLGVAGADEKGRRPLVGVERRGGDSLFPPATIDRRMRLVEKGLDLSDRASRAFTGAALVSAFDPVDALRHLNLYVDDHRARGPQAWADLVEWAFKVWRHNEQHSAPLLKSAVLRVPTKDGWRKPYEAAFSGRWTPLGTVLEELLEETSGISSDCAEQRCQLLVSFEAWPVRVRDATKSQWAEFLGLLGVRDGLKPVFTPEVHAREIGAVWNSLFENGDEELALDANWLEEIGPQATAFLGAPYHRYGEFWRLPGQMEYAAFPEDARERYSRLVIAYLSASAAAKMTFTIERLTITHKDSRTIATPLAAFVRRASWVHAELRGESVFRKTTDTWASSTDQKPPRFIATAPAYLREELAQFQHLKATFFSRSIGLRDWSGHAALRLRALAVAYEDRPALDQFRREYQRGWGDLSAIGTTVKHMPIVVQGKAGEHVIRDTASGPRIVVAGDSSGHRVQLLCDAELSVLIVPKDAVERVVTVLVESDVDAIAEHDVQVTLVVDGEVFAFDPELPGLVESAVPWLPRALRVAHETSAENLEKALVIGTVENRLRTIRLRRCAQWDLVIDGRATRPSSNKIAYAVRDRDTPTVVVLDDGFTWDHFTRSVIPEVQRLLPGQYRSLEYCLLRVRRQGGGLHAATDEELADATGRSIEVVRAFAAEAGEDIDAVRETFAGLVAYFHGVEAGQGVLAQTSIGTYAELVQRINQIGLPTSEHVHPFVQAVDAGASTLRLREIFGLDFSRYNEALGALGLRGLNDAGDLQRQFVSHLATLKNAQLMNQLRAHHYRDYQMGMSLDTYVRRKSFDFIAFDASWLRSQASLGLELVERHARTEMFRICGPTPAEAALPAYAVSIEANRRVARSAQVRIIELIRAWCDRSKVDAPAWCGETPPDLAGALVDSGLLDFDPVAAEQLPLILARVGLWPPTMPLTLDAAEAGLTETDLRAGQERRRLEQEQKARARRSIEFGGELLDADSGDFAERFTAIAEAAIALRDDVFPLFATLRLKPMMDNSEHRKGAGSGASGRAFRGGRLTEQKKAAYGMVGEWLAYRYLQGRHPEYCTEESWISSNRRLFLGGVGDDTRGYDFRVLTPSEEWLYEVKSSPGSGLEFEFTDKERRVSEETRSDRNHKYRILYVPNVADPSMWTAHELPNPSSNAGRGCYRIVGESSTRLRFAL